jgi:hypothetical protein
MPERHIDLQGADPRLKDEKVENLLREMDARMNRGATIYDAAGNPMIEPVVDDRTITYAKDGESYQADPEQLLMRAARMQRDGMGLKAIRAELDLKNVSDKLLQSALTLGLQLLNAAIAEGREPAESKTVIGYAHVEDAGDEEPVSNRVEEQNRAELARENFKRNQEAPVGS